MFLTYLWLNNVSDFFLQMKDFNFKIKSGAGKYSKLDKLYQSYLFNSIKELDENKLYRFEIYDAIINELVKNGETESFDEIKYRLTGGENPNIVMLDIVNRHEEDNAIFWLMRREITNFIEEDNLNRFF